MFPLPHLPSSQAPAKGRRAGLRGCLGAMSVYLLVFLALTGVFWIKPAYSSLFGPVNVFNKTHQMPSASDLAGRYEATHESWMKLAAAKRPRSRPSILLTAAGRAEVHGVPAWDGAEQHCKGTWIVNSGQVGFLLMVPGPVPGGNPAACRESLQSGFDLLGHAPPYRIWQTVGDTGLLYTLRSR